MIASQGWASQILPTALVIAASPASYLAVLTLLTTERPLVNAWAFSAGWFTAVLGIFVLTYAFTSPAPPQTASSANALLSGVVGVLALIGAVIVWRRQRASTGEPKQPKWLTRMERIKPIAAFGLGFLLPTYGLIPSPAIHLNHMDLSTTTVVVATLTFALVATIGAILPAVLYGASQAMRERMHGLRDRAVANQMKIVAALLVAVGLTLLVSAVTTALSLGSMSK